MSGEEEATDGGGRVGVRPALLARNLTWLTSGEVAARLLAFAVAVYLARVLGAEGFGRIGTALALVSYFGIAVDAGFDPFTIRQVARRPRRVPSLFSLVLGLRLRLALAAYAALGVVAVLAPPGAVGRTDLALVFGATLFTTAGNPAWALRGRDEMGTVALGTVLQNVAYAGAVLLLVRGPDPALIFVPVAHVTGEAARIAYQVGALRRRYPRLLVRDREVEGGRLVRESLPVGLSKALRLGYYQGDLLLLAWLASAREAGQFLAGHKLVLALVAVVLLYQQNAYPTLSRLMGTAPERGRRFQRAASRYALLVAVPVAVGGAFAAHPVVTWLFGSEYLGAVPVLAVMLSTVPLLILSSGLQNELLAVGRSELVLRSEALGLAVHVLLAALLIPRWGAGGAAGASLVGQLAILGLAVRYGRGVARAPLGRRTLAVLGAGAVMAGVVGALRSLGLPLAVGVGLAAYGAVVAAARGIGLAELRRVAGLLRGAG